MFFDIGSNIGNWSLANKDTIKNKITKEHLTNYLKHSFRIYK